MKLYSETIIRVIMFFPGYIITYLSPRPGAINYLVL